MHRILFRPFVVVLAACVLLAACATPQNKQPLTPEEQRLRQEADTFNQTMGEGAIIGCVVGGVIGLLVAGKNKGAGAGVGCAAGAALGAGAGAYVANKQKEYADTEQRYNAMIDDVHKDNVRLAALIETAHGTIATDRGRIEQIDAALAAKKISMAEAKTRMARVDENTAYLQKTVKSLKERRDQYAEAAKKSEDGTTVAQRQKMDGEIKALETQIAQLDEQLNSLVSRRKVSNVG